METQARTIPSDHRKKMVLELSEYQSTPVVVASVEGDEEAARLAEQIAGTLEQAGWHVEGVTETEFIPAPEGIIIQTPDNGGPVVDFGNLLVEAGLDIEGRITRDRDDIKVIVGTN